ncbi:MAG: LuxR C-terminal-related transcriptional regulator [Armatimonadota bacterium]
MISERCRQILREADRQILALVSGGRYPLYQYLRETAHALARTDAFYVGFCRDDRTIVFPYNYDGEEYDDPNVHPYVRGGLTEWILAHRRAYWSRQDDGRLLATGRRFGDTRRVSAEAIAAPLLSRERGGRPQVFGILSMQSYVPGVYSEETVHCLQHLADSLATALRREEEDAERRRRLEAAPAPRPPGVPDAVELLGERLKLIRRRAAALRALLPEGDSALREAAEELCRACEEGQTEAVELLLRCLSPGESPLHRLTEKEREVAELLVQGCSNREIGRRLFISETTAKTHCSNIIRKLEAGGRSGVAQLLRPYLRSTPSE